MRATTIAAAMMTALAAAGCATRAPVEADMPDPALGTAQADLRDAGGRTVARSSATQVGDSLQVRVEAAGLAPGSYGAHIHSSGRCDPPGFESAGPHWNPSNREHGRENPRGQHRGDLPNLMVGTDGQGSFEFTVPGAFLSARNGELMDADGASIVIHARPDDYRTDPSGNSGARIACGVFG